MPTSTTTALKSGTPAHLRTHLIKGDTMSIDTLEQRIEAAEQVQVANRIELDKAMEDLQLTEAEIHQFLDEHAAAIADDAQTPKQRMGALLRLRDTIGGVGSSIKSSVAQAKEAVVNGYNASLNRPLRDTLRAWAPALTSGLYKINRMVSSAGLYLILTALAVKTTQYLSGFPRVRRAASAVGNAVVNVLKPIGKALSWLSTKVLGAKRTQTITAKLSSAALHTAAVTGIALGNVATATTETTHLSRASVLLSLGSFVAAASGVPVLPQLLLAASTAVEAYQVYSIVTTTYSRTRATLTDSRVLASQLASEAVSEAAKAAAEAPVVAAEATSAA